MLPCTKFINYNVALINERSLVLDSLKSVSSIDKFIELSDNIITELH